MTSRRTFCLALAGTTLASALPRAVLAAPAVQWQPYRNERLGYSIDLPLGMFELDQSGESRDSMVLHEVGGRAQIEILGSENTQNVKPRDYADFFGAADRIRNVTYRAHGASWFVMSGHYAREKGEAEDLIFYTKYLFSPDYSAFAAFEISYPESEKQRFDSVVTRLEASLRAPESA